MTGLYINLTAKRFGVQTHYYRLLMWPMMCVIKTVLVQQTLAMSFPWFGRDYWHSSRAKNSNKNAKNAKYSSCKGGWITWLMTSAYKICDRSHFEFCLHFEFYFYPFSFYLQAKHDIHYTMPSAVTEYGVYICYSRGAIAERFTDKSKNARDAIFIVMLT